MAEVVLISALLPVVFEKSADLIGHQLRKVLGADVEKEVEKLKSLLSTVQAVLRDAEEKQLTDEPLRNWLAKLKLVAYDADDLLEDFNVLILQPPREEGLKEKVRRFFSSDNPLLFRMRMARKIKEIVGRFDSLAEERHGFHLTADAATAVGRLPGTRDGRTQTHSYVPESEVIGREADVKKIVELLIGQEHEKSVSVLPIVGMGGLGKTTLSQSVYNQPRVTEHFQLRIWVCVSDDFNVAKITADIIESATNAKCDVSSMDVLQRRLREALGGKRYLLVLDDVWNEVLQRWNELRVLLTSEGVGSAIIVTTRSGKVSSMVGTLPAFQPAQLSDDEGWRLFERLAFEGEAEASPNLVTMGEQIVKKCGGLPLAVTILGSLMKQKKEESDWKRVMESEIWNLPVGQSEILPALKLSYYHLPDHVKQCFAFCAIFPKDYRMDKELLIHLWMANGFIPSKDTRMVLELKAEEVFDELAQRSFFQNIREELLEPWCVDSVVVTKCGMHDLIHDLAQSIMGNECCHLDKLEDCLANKSIRHLSLVDNMISSTRSTLHYPETMRTLLFLGYSSHLPHYPACQYLRVLDLHWTKMSVLPISICNLWHLRYLDLSYNDIETPPEAICGLFNLQTLKLVRCRKLSELPKGMRNMSNLRHLDLRDCSSLRCMPAGMGQLRRIWTLTMYTAGEAVGSGSIGELKELNLHGEIELRGLGNVRNVTEAQEANICSKENLQRLILRWDPVGAENAEEVVEALRPHPGLKRLAIHEYHGVRFPTWLMGDTMALLNLVEIGLYDCPRCERLPQLGQLGFLERLKIRRMPSVKHMGGTAFYGRGAAGAGGTVFPLLREFTMSSMDNLEEWSGLEGSLSIFPRLVKLEMLVCPKLTTMPRLPSVRDLKIGDCPLLHPAKGFFGCMTSLERLHVDSCDKLTSLLLEQEEKNEAGRGSLRYLTIRNCHQQQQMFSPSSWLWKHLSSLQELEMESCDGLTSLPVEAVRGLSSLGTLQIFNCPNLAGGLQLQYLTALRGLHIENLPGLTSLPEGLGGLTALTGLEISKLPGLTSLPEGLGGLTALTRLHISDLPGLTSLPEGLGGLTALSRLGISRLPGLTSLPEGLGGLTALSDLGISDLPGLTSLPEGLGGLTALSDLGISDLPGLTSLPEGLGGLTALTRLRISNLPGLTSLPEGLGGLTALSGLAIVSCPHLISLPVGLQQRLPNLEFLRIDGCPHLKRRFVTGGEYWHLLARIPGLYIEGSEAGEGRGGSSRRRVRDALCCTTRLDHL